MEVLYGSKRFHKILVEAPWKPHGGSMEERWKHHHGNLMEAHGSTMEVPWRHGSPIEVPRKSHGNTMELPIGVPWNNQGRPHGRRQVLRCVILWLKAPVEVSMKAMYFHGSIVLPRKHHGSHMEVPMKTPWKFHGDNMEFP